MGRLRTGCLNMGDLGQISRFSAPDYWHIELIMRALLPLLFFLAQPFWDTKPPERWTDGEIYTIRNNSPWAQAVAPDPVVVAYLATAAPVEMAEAELRLRMKKNASRMPEPDPDYIDYLRENRESQFVLAITYPTLRGLGKAEENRRMEEETVMVIGRKTYPFAGHFPPTPSDPVLRLIFDREVKPSDRAVSFRLYLPGLNFPEREVEFRVKDLMFQGK